MEMRESIKIIEQCVQQIEKGEVRSKVPLIIRAPIGDAYSRIEAPKGELGFYLVSDGSIAPYRCKIRSPSFINLTILHDILVGGNLADLIVSFGSIDVNMGEVDR
jgi:NADH-quinone oxidoreductase subunit D